MEQRSDLTDEARQIARYTRNWIHYGIIVFIVLCSLIAALRSVVAP